MLYNKNGVITEERFQKMNVFQWLFHFCEITDMKGEDKLDILNSLGDIETSIQAFYMLVDSRNGKQMIDNVAKIKKEIREKQRELKYGKTNDNNEKNKEEYEDILSKEDKELLEFMNNQPVTLEYDEKQKHSEFILPKKTLSKVVTVENKDEVEIPKLGL